MNTQRRPVRAAGRAALRASRRKVCGCILRKTAASLRVSVFIVPADGPRGPRGARSGRALSGAGSSSWFSHSLCAVVGERCVRVPCHGGASTPRHPLWMGRGPSWARRQLSRSSLLPVPLKPIANAPLFNQRTGKCGAHHATQFVWVMRAESEHVLGVAHLSGPKTVCLLTVVGYGRRYILPKATLEAASCSLADDRRVNITPMARSRSCPPVARRA